MPLFGNFSDMPLPDVVSLIAHSTGKCDIWRYGDQHHYELFLTRGCITRMNFNGQELTDQRQTESFLKDLVRATEGKFEFERGQEVSGPHRLALDDLLMRGLAEADEIKLYAEHFPEPDTSFIATRHPHQWMDEDLSSFWNASLPYFKLGASARDLFEHLGLYLDQVQLRLYKLRSAGMIEIHRSQDVVPLHADADFDTGDIDVMPGQGNGTTASYFGVTSPASNGANPHPSANSAKLSTIHLYEADDETLDDLMSSVEAALEEEK